MNANIFGTITNIFQQLNVKTQKLQDKVDIANSNMYSLKIPRDIQENVRDYMMQNSAGMENQHELELFLNMLSPTIRNLLTKHIFIKAFNENSFFKSHH